MKKIKKEILIIIASILLIFFLTFFLVNNIVKRKLKLEKNKTEVVKSLINDTIIIYRDKDGQSVGEIDVIESYDVDFINEIDSKNELIQELQKKVKRYRKKLKKHGGSITVVKTDFKVDTITGTEIVIEDGKEVYRGEISSKWYKIKSESNKDTTSYELEVHSDLSVSIMTEKGKRKWFLGKRGKDRTFAIVTDKNPYTDIKDMKVYITNKLPKQRRLGFGIYGGVGVNNKLQPGFQVGVGLIYRLK